MSYILNRDTGRVYYFGGLNPETHCTRAGNTSDPSANATDYSMQSDHSSEQPPVVRLTTVIHLTLEERIARVAGHPHLWIDLEDDTAERGQE